MFYVNENQSTQKVQNYQIGSDFSYTRHRILRMTLCFINIEEWIQSITFIPHPKEFLHHLQI